MRKSLVDIRAEAAALLKHYQSLQPQLLKERVIVTNAKRVLASLVRRVHIACSTVGQEEHPAALCEIQLFLSTHWTTVQGSYLSYTAQAHADLTELLCHVAVFVAHAVAVSDPPNALAILMPGLNFDNTHDDYPSLESVADATTLLTILKMHILGINENGVPDCLIPITALGGALRNDLDGVGAQQVMGIRFDDQMPNPYAERFLTPAELERLQQHSEQTRDVSACYQRYMALKSNQGTLLGQLELLAHALYLNSKNGLGREEIAGAGGERAIADFFGFYQQLQNVEDAALTANLRLQIMKLRHCIGRYHKGEGKIPQIETCLATRCSALRSAMAGQEAVLASICITGETQVKLLVEAEKELIIALISIFTDATTFGCDALPLTLPLLDRLGIPLTFTSFDEFMEIFAELSPAEIANFISDAQVVKTMVQIISSFENWLMLVQGASVERLTALHVPSMTQLFAQRFQQFLTRRSIQADRQTVLAILPPEKHIYFSQLLKVFYLFMNFSEVVEFLQQSSPADIALFVSNIDQANAAVQMITSLEDWQRLVLQASVECLAAFHTDWVFNNLYQKFAHSNSSRRGGLNQSYMQFLQTALSDEAVMPVEKRIIVVRFVKAHIVNSDNRAEELSNWCQKIPALLQLLSHDIPGIITDVQTLQRALHFFSGNIHSRTDFRPLLIQLLRDQLPAMLPTWQSCDELFQVLEFNTLKLIFDALSDEHIAHWMQGDLSIRNAPDPKILNSMSHGSGGNFHIKIIKFILLIHDDYRFTAVKQALYAYFSQAMHTLETLQRTLRYLRESYSESPRMLLIKAMPIQDLLRNNSLPDLLQILEKDELECLVMDQTIAPIMVQGIDSFAHWLTFVASCNNDKLYLFHTSNILLALSSRFGDRCNFTGDWMQLPSEKRKFVCYVLQLQLFSECDQEQESARLSQAFRRHIHTIDDLNRILCGLDSYKKIFVLEMIKSNLSQILINSDNGGFCKLLQDNDLEMKKILIPFIIEILQEKPQNFIKSISDFRRIFLYVTDNSHKEQLFNIIICCSELKSILDFKTLYYFLDIFQDDKSKVLQMMGQCLHDDPDNYCDVVDVLNRLSLDSLNILCRSSRFSEDFLRQKSKYLNPYVVSMFCRHWNIDAKTYQVASIHVQEPQRSTNASQASIFPTSQSLSPQQKYEKQSAEIEPLFRAHPTHRASYFRHYLLMQPGRPVSGYLQSLFDTVFEVIANSDVEKSWAILSHLMMIYLSCSEASKYIVAATHEHNQARLAQYIKRALQDETSELYQSLFTFSNDAGENKLLRFFSRNPWRRLLQKALDITDRFFPNAPAHSVS